MTAAMQQWIALGLVGVAVGYLAQRAWRSWRASVSARNAPGCGSDCGCG
jgi:hypothetical protein